MTGRPDDDDYQRDVDQVLKGIDFDDLGPEEVDDFDRSVAEAAAKAKAKRANGASGQETHQGAQPQSPTPQLEIFDVGDEDGNIPPREWLLGTTFCRRNLSGLISAGAGGKTTVRILQAALRSHPAEASPANMCSSAAA